MESTFSVEESVRKLSRNPQIRKEYFLSLSLAHRSAVFNELSPHVKQEMLKLLSDADAVELLDHLDPYHIHLILGRMRDRLRRRRILKRLKRDVHEKIDRFLQFHQQADTSLVHLNYVFLRETTTIEQTAVVIEKHVRETGKVPAVLVSKDGKLVGESPLGTLVREPNDSPVGDYVRRVPTIRYSAKRNEIITFFKTRPHERVVVLDDDGSVLGVIYSDDVIELIGRAPAAALYDFAGVEETEAPFDSVKSKVKSRYKWLIINLCTAFMAASVVGLFEETLSQLVVLAIYMPIVAGMGGNAATQTLAVMVRGITTGEVTLKNGLPAIGKEAAAGITNGLIIGCIVALVATFWNGEPLLGFVLAIAMIFNLLVAGFFGALIPLVMKALGKDPATSATIFITTATDVFGFFAFLGLATLLLL